MMYWIALAWIIYGYRIWLDAIRLRQKKDDLEVWAFVTAALLVMVLVIAIAPLIFGAACYAKWRYRRA